MMKKVFTEKQKSSKLCIFCASEYHLEMILLPYIKERINSSKFVILSQQDLEPTLKKLLDRINIEKKAKKQIWELNWKEKSPIDIEKIMQNQKEQNLTIIINGKYEYIKNTNEYLQKNFKNRITTIDCFHIGDTNVNIEALSKKYKQILNTSFCA